MNNEEAIAILENLKIQGKALFSQRLALDLAIKALEERPKDEIIKELWNCRNELCLKCERYHEAYRGACNDCRYNFANMERWKEGSDEVADDKHL